MDSDERIFLLGLPLFLKYFLTRFFLRHFFDIFADFLHVLLQLIHVFGNLTDVFLHFFDVFAHLGQFLRREVDGHLYENREVYRFERNYRREDEKHAVEVEPPCEDRKETSGKEKRVDDDGRGRADPSGDGKRGLLYLVVRFHGGSIAEKVSCIVYGVWRVWNPISHTLYFIRYTLYMLVGNVHLIAGTAKVIPQILSLLKSQGVAVEGNPDIYTREYKAFGVDDAIELRDRSNRRPIAGSQRFFIVVTPGMTNEAQNALLKTLEEPPADAAFFIIVPAPEMLLPTLRSRAQILTLAHDGVENLIDAKAFLVATPQKRLDMLKPLLEKDEDDKRDIGNIVGFLSALERQLAKTPLGRNPATLGHSPTGEPGEAEGLHAIYRARKYIGDKGALVKPLLEQVALLVPKV